MYICVSVRIYFIVIIIDSKYEKLWEHRKNIFLADYIKRIYLLDYVNKN